MFPDTWHVFFQLPTRLHSVIWLFLYIIVCNWGACIQHYTIGLGAFNCGSSWLGLLCHVDSSRLLGSAVIWVAFGVTISTNPYITIGLGPNFYLFNDVLTMDGKEMDSVSGHYTPVQLTVQHLIGLPYWSFCYKTASITSNNENSMHQKWLCLFSITEVVAAQNDPTEYNLQRLFDLLQVLMTNYESLMCVISWLYGCNMDARGIWAWH